MNRLHRLGLASARHLWRTLAAWVLVVAVGAAATTMTLLGRRNWWFPRGGASVTPAPAPVSAAEPATPEADEPTSSRV